MTDQTKVNPEELVDYIKKAGKAQRSAEFQCPYIPDFFVEIAYASKFVLLQIRDATREIWTNPRTREREERLNDDKLRSEYARNLIRNWRGLTVGRLAKLVPGTKVEGEVKPSEDTVIPFRVDIAIAILEVSAEFENWILSIATEVENYSSLNEQKKKELENLK